MSAQTSRPTRRWLRLYFRDLSAATRAAFRRPRAAVLAVAVLGLGIGASTALFSVLDGVLLRGLPFPEGHRIVTVSAGESRDWPMAAADLRELREHRLPFEEVAGFLSLNSVLTHPERGSQSFTTSYVTGNLFSMLGAEPLLGRVVLLEDEDPAAPQVVVISHRLWRSHFDGDPGVIGDQVLLDREAATVVGVMPEGFHFPIRQEAWSAFRFAGQPWSEGSLFAIARLAAAGAPHDAELALAPLFLAFDAARPLPQPRRAWVTPYTAAVLPEQIQRALRVMFWAGCGLLLVACANTANLRLQRALDGAHEAGVRSALGATRFDLLRAQLGEALVLAAAGTAVGLVFAWLATRLAERHLLEGSLLVRQFWIEVRLDARSLAFAAAAATVALVLGGALPALGAASSQTLRAGARMAGSRRSLRLQRAIVAFEVGASFALLAGTALLLQGARELLSTRPGFDPDGLSRTLVNTYQARLDGPSARLHYWQRALEGLRARPELAGVTLVSRPPWWVDGGLAARVRVEGSPVATPDRLPAVALDLLLPGAIEMLGMPVLQGRGFLDEDASPPSRGPDGGSEPAARGRERSMVVSESFARRRLTGPPLGQRLELWLGSAEEPTLGRVVGVVADLGLDRTDHPGAEERVYLPMDEPGRFLLVRARTARGEVLRVLDEELARANPLVATLDHRTYSQERAEATWVERRLLQLFLLFGGAALLLSAAGLFGVLMLAARRRERELGIRAAIGARPRDLRALVWRQGGQAVAAGLLAGAWPVALVLRLLDEVLAGVEVHAPLALVLAALVIAAATLGATLPPARRAGGADPARLLRAE